MSRCFIQQILRKWLIRLIFVKYQIPFIALDDNQRVYFYFKHIFHNKKLLTAKLKMTKFCTQCTAYYFQWVIVFKEKPQTEKKKII